MIILKICGFSRSNPNTNIPMLLRFLANSGCCRGLAAFLRFLSLNVSWMSWLHPEKSHKAPFLFLFRPMSKAKFQPESSPRQLLHKKPINGFVSNTCLRPTVILRPPVFCPLETNKLKKARKSWRFSLYIPIIFFGNWRFHHVPSPFLNVQTCLIF